MIRTFFMLFFLAIHVPPSMANPSMASLSAADLSAAGLSGTGLSGTGLSGASLPGFPSEPAPVFSKCGTARRVNCVVDGDTFWHGGAKIRIADINTPETSRPSCAQEAGLGARATLRLTQLLNAGPFSLEQQGRDVDHYGRRLRIVTRGGKSLGRVLVDEGLAERWTGKRGSWCPAA